MPLLSQVASWLRATCRASGSSKAQDPGVANLAPATTEALLEAAKRGLDLSTHTSKGIEGIHREQIDLFLVTEKGQKESILLDYPKLKYKTYLLSELTGLSFSIPDPYVTGEFFSEIASEIETLIKDNFAEIIRLAKRELRRVDTQPLKINKP